MCVLKSKKSKTILDITNYLLMHIVEYKRLSDFCLLFYFIQGNERNNISQPGLVTSLC
jgi:hypothetical protein